MKRKRNYILEYVISNKLIKFQFESTHADLALITEIFALDAYDFKMPDNVKTIVDAGANKGATAIYFKAKCPSAEIICIEPNKDIVPLLKHNLELNNIDALIIEKALTDTVGFVNFRVDPRHSFSRVTDDSKDTLVSSTTLDHEFAGRTIDLLKLDIEGSEEKVIDSIKKTRVRSVILEAHYGLGTNFESLYKSITKLGLQIDPPRKKDTVLSPNEAYPMIIAK